MSRAPPHRPESSCPSLWGTPRRQPHCSTISLTWSPRAQLHYHSTGASICLTLKIRGKPSGGSDPPSNRTYLICKQRMLKEYRLRSFYETNLTTLPIYIISLISLLFEFVNHIFNESEGFLELLGEGQVSGLTKKWASGIEKEAGDPLAWFPRSEGFPGIQNFQC